MDPDSSAEDSAEVQAALLGALLSTGGSSASREGPHLAATDASGHADVSHVAGNQITSTSSPAVGDAVETFRGLLESGGADGGGSSPDDAEDRIESLPSDIDDPKPPGVGRVILEWAVVLVGAVVMALLLRQYLFQAFYIPSESMETTLEIRDRVLVNRLSYQWGDVGRGDVVVFARKPEDPGDIRDLIKRVIALPGETIEGRDNTIYIDGVRLDEPYIQPENRIFADFGPIVVPDGELFMMGDNRDQSFDSRFFGTVDLDRVAGRAFVLYWPLDRVGSL